MKFLIKTSKGYICYRDYGEYAYTQFRDDAERYNEFQAERIKKDLASKGIEAIKVVA